MTIGQARVRLEISLQPVVTSFALLGAEASTSRAFGYDLNEKGLPTPP